MGGKFFSWKIDIKVNRKKEFKVEEILNLYF